MRHLYIECHFTEKYLNRVLEKGADASSHVMNLFKHLVCHKIEHVLDIATETIIVKATFFEESA